MEKLKLQREADEVKLKLQCEVKESEMEKLKLQHEADVTKSQLEIEKLRLQREIES